MKESELMLRFGRSLRSRRKALGITQAELADLAGCGTAFVHLVEHGKPSLQLDKLLDIMEVLGLQFRLESGTERIHLDPT